MLLLILVLVLVGAVALYCRQTYTKFSKHGVKHLKPVPLLGNMARTTLCMEYYFQYHNKVYNSFPGERFVGYFEYLNPVVVIRDIDLVKKVTVTDFDYFTDHSMIVDENVDPLCSAILIIMRGQKWKDMRSAVSPAFTSAKMRLMVPFMVGAGENMVRRIKRGIQQSGINFFDVDFKDIACRHANDVLASCGFGLTMDSQNQPNTQFYEMANVASQINFLQLLKMFGYQSFPNIMKILKTKMFSKSTENFFKELVSQTIKDREERNIYRADFMDLLIKIRNEWTENNLVAQALSFFLAGFEFVSQTIVFLVYELALNPEVQERLVLEIKENERKNGSTPDYESIQQMTYLDRVVSEVLRLWTPEGSLDRVCTKDYNLGRPNDNATENYIIRKGEGIKVPVWALHRDPQFFPEPEKFNPERFSKENRQKIPPFVYLPFGIGPRSCTGSRFALCEVKMAIYQLLQHIQILPCKKTKPIELVPSSNSVRIKGGHWVQLRIRE